jgi:hypothetical protein
MGKILATVGAIAALALGAGVAVAATTFNSDGGTGFVGKGDVQIAFGWSNKDLQRNAGLVQFRFSDESVTETSWTCTNSNNDNEQVRNRTTTVSVQSVVDTVARQANQVTGFLLEGYDGTPVSSSSSEGPHLNSCPSGPWELSTPAGDPEVVSSSSALDSNALYVSADGIGWRLLP